MAIGRSNRTLHRLALSGRVSEDAQKDCIQSTDEAVVWCAHSTAAVHCRLEWAATLEIDAGITIKLDPEIASIKIGVITDFLASNPTPQEIIAYRLPDYLQGRAHDLRDKNGEDLLTPDEQKEMTDFSRIDHMLTMLKAKTRLKLKKASE